MRVIHLAATAALLLGCSTSIALTEGGARVRNGSRADMPPGCRLLSDVRIGIPPDAAMPPTREDLIVLMRNKTHEQGGNFVIVESVEQRDTNEDGEVFYRGRGTSYACPEEEPETVSLEGGDDGATSGGEEPVEDDDGYDDDSSAVEEDDPILDDLLSD